MIMARKIGSKSSPMAKAKNDEFPGPLEIAQKLAKGPKRFQKLPKGRLNRPKGSPTRSPMMSGGVILEQKLTKNAKKSWSQNLFSYGKRFRSRFFTISCYFDWFLEPRNLRNRGFRIGGIAFFLKSRFSFPEWLRNRFLWFRNRF